MSNANLFYFVNRALIHAEKVLFVKLNDDTA